MDNRLARANPEVRNEARPAAAPAQAPAQSGGAPPARANNGGSTRTTGTTRKPGDDDRRSGSPSGGTGDAVALSPQAQDAAATERRNLDRRLPEEDRSEPDGVETHSDGTVVERKDGRTTTKKPDGSVREEYLDGDRWVVEDRYVAPDGTKVHDKETQHTNGDVQTVSTAEKNGRVETTESYTTDENVEIPPTLRNQHGDEMRAAENGQYQNLQPGVSGEPEKPTRTTVRQTVTDTTKNPPVTTELLNRTTYTEHSPLGDYGFGEDDRASGGSASGWVDVNGEKLYKGLDVHQAGSGKTRSFSEETFLGPDGKQHTRTTSGVRTVIAGTKDGKDVEVSQGSVFTTQDGDTREVRTREMKGIYDGNGKGGEDVAKAGPIDDKEEYLDRLGDGPLNYRKTEVFGPDGSLGSTQEYGDYTNPNSAGRSVAISDSPDGRRYWTYRQVDNTDTGVRIQQQTSLEGSDEYVRSDGYQNRDGTYSNDTKYYDDKGKVVRSERASRERVDARYMASRNAVDGTLRNDFVNSNQGRDMYEDQVVVDDTRHPEQNQDVTVYTAEGSDDRLASVRHGGKDVTILEDPGSAAPARMSADGVQFAIDREGNSYALVDGERVNLPAPPAPEGPGAHGYTDNGAQAVRNLYASIATAKAGGVVTDVGGKLATPMAGLTGGVGVANIYLGVRDGNVGQTMGGIATTTTAVGEGSMLAAGVIANSGVSRALTTGGRVLGAFGAGLSIGNGVHQIADGDYVGGALSIAGGVGGGMVVGAGIAGVAGWVPIAGWAIAGTALAAGIGWDMYHGHQEAHKTHKLEF